MKKVSTTTLTRQILGIEFFCGTASQAVERMRAGGLLVVPAAPALKEIQLDPGYRDALLSADLAIADSALMVVIWNALEHDNINRLSGLTYIRTLLREPDVCRPGNCVWVMAGQRSSDINLHWLSKQGVTVPPECVYLAPIYDKDIEDVDLLALLRVLRPQHVIITLGGGKQEKLGLYLKRNLDYLPSIHCIGAAIAFLSGDQVKIPLWADRIYLGWLFRCISNPRSYVPRYWAARKLLSLMVGYRKAQGRSSGAESE